jgi:hypothetical protein
MANSSIPIARIEHMTLKHAASCALAMGLASALVPAAKADTASDIAQLRKEMKSLKGDYEKRIHDLEERLQKAETKASDAEAKANSQASTAVAAAEPPPPLPVAAPSAPTSQSAFNPGISVALNGTYNYAKRDPALAKIPGFVVSDDAKLHDRGFSLDESEVTFSANVDHVLTAQMTASFDGQQGGVNIEEAYVQTLDLPAGLTAKAGRFFSGIGYLNERHSHDWQFMDAPLPYRAFLGNQYGDDGIGVRWLAPTDFYLQFGAEWFRGDAFPAGNASNNGTGTYTAFAKTGDDINDEWSWLAGLSYLHTKADHRDNDGDIFDGEDQTAIATAVLKWARNGNPKDANLSITGEYFFNAEKGQFNGTGVDLNRSGWYTQAVYQFDPQWSAGVRYASLSGDSVPLALTGSTLDDLGRTPNAITGLVEYDTSEFGRLRLQYTHDDSDVTGNDLLSVGYTIILGPHGAHRY